MGTDSVGEREVNRPPALDGTAYLWGTPWWFFLPLVPLQSTYDASRWSILLMVIVLCPPHIFHETDWLYILQSRPCTMTWSLDKTWHNNNLLIVIVPIQRQHGDLWGQSVICQEDSVCNPQTLTPLEYQRSQHFYVLLVWGVKLVSFWFKILCIW